MNLSETPSITSSTYGTSSGTAYAITDTILANAVAGQQWPANMNAGWLPPKAPPVTLTVTQTEEEVMSDLRIVRVYIADTDENLPVDKRLLYAGEELTTDLTDQELFFEVPIQDLLKTHNAARAQTRDKDESTKDREVFLEPVRIRDLKMIVLTIARF